MRGLRSPPLYSPPLSPSWPPSPTSFNRRRTLPLFGACLCLFVFFNSLFKAPTAGTTRWSQLFSASSAVPTATLGADLSFSDYLDAHWPLDAKGQQHEHLWITLADGLFAKTGAANLDGFIRQLNVERRQKYGRKVKDTFLITLCLDEVCVEECAERGMHAYGGFERQRPEQIFLIEALPERDLFFVDADVSFAQDPYPHMEPLIPKYDLLAQENDAFEHFNTGWLWMRKGQAVADAWRKVLEMDMVQVSRDQINFNWVLDTGPRRLHNDSAPWQRPLESDFVAQNGLRVHVLDQRQFRVYHQRKDAWVSRHDSTFLHMTCADDAWVKLFVPKVEGFWTDLDGYYSSPPQLLSVDQLSGPRDDLAQLFRILVALAHYSQRALSLPSHAIITDLDKASSTPVRASYETFPLSQLAASGSDSPLNVTIVEPAYVEHATSWLLGQSVLDTDERREDGWWERLGRAERERRMDLALSMTKVFDLDMRPHFTFAELLAKVLSDPLFASASHIRLVNTEWPGFEHWRHWQLPATVSHVGTCARLELMPSCDEVCRFDGEKRIRVDEPWPSLEQVLGLEQLDV
ncbi:uncharacterized protein RHOBADRAFT_52325 [Rhodotorula graminis WP1]|uniref:Nucleotide-diphospho-sugar transferase domain-containing protein n=1 Tax=Rhodotorula graminis (strain WP1) TaxID=578459 RepID=A0A194S724_RHOGW|nr:uncharacterized protein RHOBADRAFT_52325 [Rhodotorula graminis WP1]KPV76300.1 hypothetical protein RHOBADRAFT_52325 [Rhodotorula graminis WP1]